MGTARLIRSERPASSRAPTFHKAEKSGKLARNLRFTDKRSFPPSGSSPGTIEKRRKAAEQARAANIRQGYVHDPALEEAIVRYVAGDITREEYRQLMIEAPVKITPDQPSRAEGRLLRADSLLLSFAMADERPKVPTPILIRQTIRTGRTF